MGEDFAGAQFLVSSWDEQSRNFDGRAAEANRLRVFKRAAMHQLRVTWHTSQGTRQMVSACCFSSEYENARPCTYVLCSGLLNEVPILIMNESPGHISPFNMLFQTLTCILTTADRTLRTWWACYIICQTWREEEGKVVGWWALNRCFSPWTLSIEFERKIPTYNKMLF